MVSSRLKKKFEDWVSSRVKALTFIGLTPNSVTLIGLITSFGTALCYISWRISNLMLIAAATSILFSGLLDALDGVLARATGGASSIGGFLDSMSDRYSDAVVLASIIISGLCHPFWGLAAIIGSIMVSYSRARAEAAGVEMAAVGFAERAERMLLLSAVTFTSYFRLDVLNWGVALLAVLAHLTVFQRTFHFYRKTKRQ